MQLLSQAFPTKVSESTLLLLLLITVGTEGAFQKGLTPSRGLISSRRGAFSAKAKKLATDFDDSYKPGSSVVPSSAQPSASSGPKIVEGTKTAFVGNVEFPGVSFGKPKGGGGSVVGEEFDIISSAPGGVILRHYRHTSAIVPIGGNLGYKIRAGVPA